MGAVTAPAPLAFQAGALTLVGTTECAAALGSGEAEQL